MKGRAPRRASKLTGFPNSLSADSGTPSSRVSSPPGAENQASGGDAGGDAGAQGAPGAREALRVVLWPAEGETRPWRAVGAPRRPPRGIRGSRDDPAARPECQFCVVCARTLFVGRRGPLPRRCPACRRRPVFPERAAGRTPCATCGQPTACAGVGGGCLGGVLRALAPPTGHGTPGDADGFAPSAPPAGPAAPTVAAVAVPDGAGGCRSGVRTALGADRARHAHVLASMQSLRPEEWRRSTSSGAGREAAPTPREASPRLSAPPAPAAGRVHLGGHAPRGPPPGPLQPEGDLGRGPRRARGQRRPVRAGRAGGLEPADRPRGGGAPAAEGPPGPGGPGHGRGGCGPPGERGEGPEPRSQLRSDRRGVDARRRSGSWTRWPPCPQHWRSRPRPPAPAGATRRSTTTTTGGGGPGPARSAGTTATRTWASPAPPARAAAPSAPAPSGRTTPTPASTGCYVACPLARLRVPVALSEWHGSLPAGPPGILRPGGSASPRGASGASRRGHFCAWAPPASRPVDAVSDSYADIPVPCTTVNPGACNATSAIVDAASPGR